MFGITLIEFVLIIIAIELAALGYIVFEFLMMFGNNDRHVISTMDDIRKSIQDRQ